MKKAFIPFILCLSVCLFSCSGESDSGSSNSSFVKFKVDGVQKTFTKVTVDQQADTGDNFAYVIAANKDNPSEYVDFYLNDTEEFSINGFTLHEGDVTYENVGANTTFSSTTTQNSNGRFKGTFTAHLKEFLAVTIMSSRLSPTVQLV